MFTKHTDPMWQQEYETWVNGIRPDTKFGTKFDEQPRELIQKLALHITDRKFVKEIKTSDAEYYGMAPWVTDEMAEVALTMKVHKVYKVDEILKMNKKHTREHLVEILEELCQVGIVEYKFENDINATGEKMYALPPYIVGSGEYMGMKKSMVEKEPTAAMLFDRMAFEPLKGFTQFVPPGGSGMAMHVVPVEKAIPAQSNSVSHEHLSYWLDKYEIYATVPCVCRMSKEIIDEGAGEDYEDMCIAVGSMARYAVETHRGHYITYDEVMEILQRAEDQGCVHQITNLDGDQRILGICNCSPATCCAIRSSQFFNCRNLSRSAYVAHVDTENCVACGKCVEVCPVGAVKLGQKLCTKDGPIQYPKAEVPDETRWPEEKWNPNYRYDARTNCHDTGTAPCKTACPAHIAIQGYLKMANEGRYSEALALIKQDNPFPAICGRVCNRRCEDACMRGNIDAPVAIDAVKKYIAELDLKAETRYIPEIRSEKRYGRFDDVKVAVIGAGPAGLSCAYYLALMGYYPTVFEKNKYPGGMMRYGIPEYKLGKKVIEAEIQVLKELGVEIRCGVEIGKNITVEQLRKEGYKSFYVAIGAQKAAALGIPGEELALGGVDFLHEVAEGKKPALGKKVVVVGGGNVAIDVARTVIRLGVKDVTIVYRRTEKDMKADALEVKEAREDGVKFLFEHKPVEIVSKDGKITAFRCECGDVKCDTVIAAIGQKIDLGGIAAEGLALTDKDTVIAKELTYQTNVPDIFAGGDVQTGPKFVIDAIAAGREAAISMHRYMRPHSSLTLNRNRRDYIELDKSKVVLPIDKLKAPERQCEAYENLTEEQVKFETSRCLGCGASIVDENRCIGCGLCTTRCHFDAIHLSRDVPECSNLVPREDTMKVMLPYMAKRAAKIAIKDLKAKLGK
ncbi:nADPH-dependent glutamate synthase beta chain and related oxidoreductases [Firmicutes bacterium CAG:555]|nr:nADPH-dependent glutamate synthase beta chain and related oxidoreductases [Firmicutes bacterium CAG:555]